MRIIVLLTLLVFVTPNYAEAYFVRDKEYAEVCENIQRQIEQAELIKILHSRPQVEITHKRREELTVEELLASSMPSYRENVNGLVEGHDQARLADLREKTSKVTRPTGTMQVSRYFTVKLNQGETVSRRFFSSTPTTPLLVLIEQDPGEYCVEVEYLSRVNGAVDRQSYTGSRMFLIPRDLPWLEVVVRVTRIPEFRK